MTEPQRMNAAESALMARLRSFITAETGETNPIDVRFVWTGHGRGVVSYAYGDDAHDLHAAALAIEGDVAHEIRVLEVGGPLVTDEPAPRPGAPEWVDTERMLAEIRAAGSQAHEWNEQIEAAAVVARDAFDRGIGVIVTISRERNLVEARPSWTAVKGTAYVFDLDRLNPTPDLAYLSRIDPKDLRP